MANNGRPQNGEWLVVKQLQNAKIKVTLKDRSHNTISKAGQKTLIHPLSTSTMLNAN